MATVHGVNMILDTLAEAFQGEYDVSGSHTVYVSQAKEVLVKSQEQDGDIDVETALAALEQESDTASIIPWRKGNFVVLGLPKKNSVYSTHHDDSSGATESQRQDPGEGMSPLVGQTPCEWYG